MGVKLLTEHHFEFLRLKGRCTGSSESRLVKMPLCWKSRVAALMSFFNFTPTEAEERADNNCPEWHEKILVLLPSILQFDPVTYLGWQRGVSY